MLVLLGALIGSFNPPMAVSQPKSPSWSEGRSQELKPTIELPCLNSSNECVEQLTEERSRFQINSSRQQKELLS
ncbi:hypothetical protein [Myxosarcina sp. GI1(2024)]